jgi:hypothetical protein
MMKNETNIDTLKFIQQFRNIFVNVVVWISRVNVWLFAMWICSTRECEKKKEESIRSTDEEIRLIARWIHKNIKVLFIKLTSSKEMIVWIFFRMFIKSRLKYIHVIIVH